MSYTNSKEGAHVSYLSFQLLAQLCYCLLKPVCRILMSDLNCFLQVSVTGVALLAVFNHLTADLVDLEKEGGELALRITFMTNSTKRSN